MTHTAKKTFLALLLFITLAAGSVFARPIETGKQYQGKVESVAVGFCGHIGVKLVGFDNVVILLNGNPHQNKILSLLITAQLTNTDVNIYCTGTSGNYVILAEASLGDWPLWIKS